MNKTYTLECPVLAKKRKAEYSEKKGSEYLYIKIHIHLI
jgi:hypothetical protein